MLRIVATISALLAGIALLLVGSGLLNTLLPLRGAVEGFSDQTLGLFGSAYFAGFMLGTWLCPKLIRRMGHIRAFAFFASAAAACIILHVIHIDMLFWLLLRLATGTVLVGVYTSIESWLNTGAPKEQRGRVFAVYMVVNLGALALAQQLLQMENPLANLTFGIAAFFVIVAIMPVVATRLPQPEMVETTTLSLKALWRAAPVACAGAMLAGLAMGAFWGLGALFAGRVGMDTSQVASFMSLIIIAGAVFQWPMGVVSDRIDRRLALAIVCGVAAVGGVLMALLSGSATGLLIGAAIFGAGSFSVYPTVVAHLIDHLRKEEVLSGNAGMLMLHGTGSAIGPALAGWLMGVTSTLMLPLYFAMMFAAAALFAMLRWRDRRDRIVDEPARHVSMVGTSPEALEMVVDGQKPDETAMAEADAVPGSAEAGAEPAATGAGDETSPADRLSGG